MRLPLSISVVLGAVVTLGGSVTGCTTSGEHAAAEASVAAPALAASAPVEPTPVHTGGAPVTGTVAETMGAAGYTYVRLTTAQGEQWAAIPQAQVAVGDTVTIASPMMIDGFQSPTLHRTFDHILFGTLAAAGAPPQGGAPSGNPHPGMFPGAAAEPTLVPGAPVPKATGPDAHTVAEVVTGKDTLKDKPVTVRGRVTKYNGGILGKNWLHLQDGSGKGGADGDLMVTTSGTAAVGDVVTVKGVVHTNRDFGSGYAYAVMIEDATLSK